MTATPKPTSENDTITCKQSVEWVSLERDQALSADKQKLLHQHIKHCPRCAVAKQQFDRMFAGLDDLLAR